MKKFVPMIILLMILANLAMANKSAVSIVAPEKVKAGEEIILVINVSHRGNSSLHYTKRVVVMANKKEIARWEFSASNRPEAENFSREVRLKVEEETEITAEATCNIHGSAGPAKVNIKVEE